MSCYEIEGGRPLEGRLTVQGAKNSVLPILAAALLAPGESVIHNCPNLSDVDTTLDILRLLGCEVRREGHTVTVDTRGVNGHCIPARLTGEMRSSVIFLGALLARQGKAKLSDPGGCRLGPRPIDLHIAALEQMGAEILSCPEGVSCRGKLRGCRMRLPIPSVGATENILLAACGAEGETVLTGAAREPEILDLQKFLRAMGADVSGAGTSVITVRGGKRLHGTEHTVMGDRICAATLLCAAGAAGGEVELDGSAPHDLASVLDCLSGAGCSVKSEGERIALKSGGRLRGIPAVRTAPFPGFPTDAQAILMAALAGGRGSTLFEENIFACRYHHVEPLRRMGAKIWVSGRCALVSGVGKLRGAPVQGRDLRGTAALVVAGLAAEGATKVSGLEYIQRGYEGLDRSLTHLGAQITVRP